MEDLLTRHEAAARLRIGLRTLDRRLATGELKCYRLGDGPRAPVRITEAQLQAYLERQKMPYVQARAQELLERA
ncbi:MAG: helix-turn-helix domain-containing protein [Candidatus Hydrogenedentes bacterium]|nr:helix-turn-helix domain-containing protein [Candidatus Hydrogenedentota bacterium]